MIPTGWLAHIGLAISQGGLGPWLVALGGVAVGAALAVVLPRLRVRAGQHVAQGMMNAAPRAHGADLGALRGDGTGNPAPRTGE